MVLLSRFQRFVIYGTFLVTESETVGLETGELRGEINTQVDPGSRLIPP